MQRDFDADNRLTAGIVLDDVEKYGGESAGLVRWARLWASKHGAEPAGDERQAAREQMVLTLEETVCREPAGNKMAGEQEVVHASAGT